MPSDHERYQQLQLARQDVIQKLTELNSRHIQSQGHISGLELHLNRCREALDRGDTSEDHVASIAHYEREYEALEKTRHDIDRERDALNDELLAIDGEIQTHD